MFIEGMYVVGMYIVGVDGGKWDNKLKQWLDSKMFQKTKFILEVKMYMKSLH